jgi:hypothetical protein
MKPLLVYVYAGPNYLDYAARFVSCYANFPPGADHDSLIVCNGVPADGMVRMLFSSLANVNFVQHDNSGFDIGAFQFASSIQPPRIGLFFGASAFFQRPGWMSRVLESSARRGLGLYGSMGNAGDNRVRVFPHIRTTGFWLSTELFNNYPFKVKQAGQRYEFEHGQTCLTEWCKQQGYMPWVATWDTEYPPHMWDHIPNGFHRGDQSNLLFKDRLCEPPFY